MANRQPRDPGTLQQLNAAGTVRTAIPQIAVAPGQAWAARAQVNMDLHNSLAALADKAAAQEGQLAGLAHGAATAQSFLRKRQADRTAAARVEQSAIAEKPGEWLTQKLMQDFGLSRGAAAGFVGNLDHETGGFKHMQELAPVVAGSRGGRNIAMWTGPRRKAFEAWASERGLDPDSIETGYGFLHHELKNTSEGRVLDRLQGVNDPAEAARIVSQTFLRPGIPHMQRRVSRAMAYAGTPDTSAAFDRQPLQATQGDTGAPDQPLSTAPLALRTGWTIRGQAFNEAALRSWSWRLESGLSNDLQAVHDAHRDDPEGFATAMETVRKEYRDQIAGSDPRAVEIFDQNFQRRADAYSQDVVSRHEARLRNQEIADTGAGLDAQADEMARRSYLLGASPDAEATAQEDIERGGRAIDAAIANGTLSPQEGQRRKDALVGRIANARTRGVFDALPTPEAKEQFALSLIEEWAKGKGPLKSLDYETVKALSDSLYRDARVEVNRQQSANRTERARVARILDDDVASIAETGQGLDMAEAGIDMDRARAVLGDEAMAQYAQARARAQALFEAGNGMETQTGPEIAERLDALKPKPGEADYIAKSEIHAAASKRAAAVLKNRKEDPLGQAAQAGAIDLPALDFSSPEALADTLGRRKAAAEQTAALYGTPMTVFRPQERAAIVRAMENNPAMIPEFALAIGKTFGASAPAALSEISEQGPALAQAAAIANATGDASVAEDIARVMEARQTGAWKHKQPPADRFRHAAFSTVGNALDALPGTHAAVLETAALLFDQQAAIKGFDPADVAKPGSPAQEAYAAALDRALGARMINGVKHGGIAQINGQQTLLPHDMHEEQVQMAMETITRYHLEAMPRMVSGNGIEIDVDQIRQGHLVAQGDGRYFVALGDPQSSAPQYVFGENGQPWVLDMRALVEMQARTIPGG